MTDHIEFKEDFIDSFCSIKRTLLMNAIWEVKWI